MKHPTLSDVAEAAGVGIATVDRVINRRQARVRPETAQLVLRAAESIGYRGAGMIRRRIEEKAPRRTLGFLLQKQETPFYRALAQELIDATHSNQSIVGQPIIEYVDELSPSHVVGKLHRLAEKVDAVAIVTADHPQVRLAIDQIHDSGVPVFTLVSDIIAAKRAGHIGRENRKAGRTAAWTLDHMTRQKGKLVVLLGSHRYLCQETCESGFRSYFREHGRGFQVLETLVSHEESDLAGMALRELLVEHPDLVGLYVAGGGIEGILEVLRSMPPGQRPFTVCHEITEYTRQALIDGTVQVVMSHSLALQAAKLVESMARVLAQGQDPEPQHILVPLEYYTAENV